MFAFKTDYIFWLGRDEDLRKESVASIIIFKRDDEEI